MRRSTSFVVRARAIRSSSARAAFESRRALEDRDDAREEAIEHEELAPARERTAGAVRVAEPLLEGLLERLGRGIGANRHAAIPPNGASACSTSPSSAFADEAAAKRLLGRLLQQLGRQPRAGTVVQGAPWIGRGYRADPGNDPRRARPRGAASCRVVPGGGAAATRSEA